MHFQYKTKGTCSQLIDFDINDGILTNVSFTGGCNGNLSGIARLVEPMALAATACGADGLIIEVHNDPMHALCDGAQSLRPEVYDDLAKKVRSIREVIAK